MLKSRKELEGLESKVTKTLRKWSLKDKEILQLRDILSSFSDIYNDPIHILKELFKNPVEIYENDNTIVIPQKTKKSKEGLYGNCAAIVLGMLYNLRDTELYDKLKTKNVFTLLINGYHPEFFNSDSTNHNFLGLVKGKIIKNRNSISYDMNRVVILDPSLQVITLSIDSDYQIKKPTVIFNYNQLAHCDINIKISCMNMYIDSNKTVLTEIENNPLLNGTRIGLSRDKRNVIGLCFARYNERYIPIIHIKDKQNNRTLVYLHPLQNIVKYSFQGMDISESTISEIKECVDIVNNLRYSFRG
ncbi:hypothetical protein KY366_00625 [Candidatus Woesearchaeota archaeon]|nr:hypothetical protein [Candidatus Woesearchaeota archaeon]